MTLRVSMFCEQSLGALEVQQMELANDSVDGEHGLDVIVADQREPMYTTRTCSTVR